MLLVIIRIHCRGRIGIAALFWQRRVVAQFFVVGVKVDRIQTETIHTTTQPEPCDIQKRIVHSGAMKVQIRLGNKEIMQIILLAASIPLPRRATKDL